MAQTLTVELPDGVYKRVVHTATATKQPVEKVVVRFIENGLPPLGALDEFDIELQTLEALDDDTLWEILKSRVPTAIQRNLHKLLDKNQVGTLTEREQQKLESLQSEADLVMLRKAHAAVLRDILPPRI